MLKMDMKEAEARLRVAVFGSGRGSNFNAIQQAIRNGSLPHVNIAVVISNNGDAGILELARSFDIPALHLSSRQFPNEDAYVEALLTALRERGVNFIVLAGYMKRLHPRIIEAFRNRVINIHPALLPKFGGKGMYGEHVHRAVLASGDRESGASVHLVDEEYDRGPVVLRGTVPVLPSDTVDSLSARVLSLEHKLYAEALRLIAEGKISLKDTVVQRH
jgi:phosphoribosylglycinamide formyltransferase-1